ncbi:MAG: Rieske 2Fe-2S domain-containing protein [Thiobacillaceae bacterium]|jgi:nitrite reductase/ring-hydroxylating ferredoxin subunit|nr:Rieske 2Fe-2S domain-containing protein [Thiobacillaceae bacterium]
MAARQRLICASADLTEAGHAVRFAVRRGEGEEQAFAVRWRGEVRAYLNRCGHVPVEMDWQPGEFFDHSRLYLICATHGALYDPATGACLGGRCDGRGLIAVPAVERDGNVYCEES